MIKSRSLHVCALACALIMISAQTLVAAQSYPQKPIRLVVGVPAGGTTDVVARLVGQKLGGQVSSGPS